MGDHLVLVCGLAVGSAWAAKLKIGMVFDIGGKGDQSLNDSAYRGLQWASKLDISHVEIEPGADAGRGFIGLASMIFGKWTPFGTAGAGMLFGFGEALKPYLPKVVPSQFIDMIPYVLTILVLASAIGRATPPASIGVPYVKE